MKLITISIKELMEMNKKLNPKFKVSFKIVKKIYEAKLKERQSG